MFRELFPIMNATLPRWLFIGCSGRSRVLVVYTGMDVSCKVLVLLTRLQGDPRFGSGFNTIVCLHMFVSLYMLKKERKNKPLKEHGLHMLRSERLSMCIWLYDLVCVLLYVIKNISATIIARGKAGTAYSVSLSAIYSTL